MNRLVQRGVLFVVPMLDAIVISPFCVLDLRDLFALFVFLPVLLFFAG